MAEPKNRPKRVPLARRNILTAPKREGYVNRWVNDTDDRIEAFKNAGYEIVSGDVQVGDNRVGSDSQMGSAVVKSVGGGTRAVLMQIKQEWYDEDQAEKYKRVKASESAMVPKQNDGQYGSIKIGH